MASTAERGAGPTPNTVTVPGGISVCPASLTRSQTRPPSSALAYNWRRWASSSARNTILRAPTLFQRSYKRAAFFFAFIAQCTAACEHCAASLPLDNLRSSRVTKTIVTSLSGDDITLTACNWLSQFCSFFMQQVC
jgi:hypothetical protein